MSRMQERDGIMKFEKLEMIEWTKRFEENKVTEKARINE